MMNTHPFPLLVVGQAEAEVISTENPQLPIIFTEDSTGTEAELSQRA